MTQRNVHFFLAPDDMIGSFYFRDTPQALEQVRLRRADYRLAGMIPTDLVGEEAAEMVFDLSNNPCKEATKAAMGWTGRSLSVGDIVVVDGVEWICLSFGWKIL